MNWAAAWTAFWAAAIAALWACSVAAVVASWASHDVPWWYAVPVLTLAVAVPVALLVGYAA